MVRSEPWRRFESQVDASGQLPATERRRRAKIAYKAHMRSIARKGAKTRAAKKARREAALKRRLERGPSQAELRQFHREREEFMASVILRAAAERGEKGIADLRRRQRKVRSDCLLCGRPFGV